MATTRRREAGSGPPVRDSDAARAAEAVVDTPTLGGEATPLPTGAIVFTETQEDRDRLSRPVGAEPDVEDRFVALQRTDERQQAEINEAKATLTQRIQDIDYLGQRLADIDIRLRSTEEAVDMLEASQPPRSDHPYNFKAFQELAWAIGTVIVTVLLQALADVENVTDWKAWAIGVGAACLRAVLGLILAQGHVTSGVEPTSHVPTSGGARHS